jgi:hypothetical protein
MEKFMIRLNIEKKENMAKKLILSLIICLGLFVSFTPVGQAQGSEYQIHLRRDFGYSMGSDIQGRFTISLIGDETPVDQVTLYIDGDVLHSVQTAPFRYQFQTDDYDPGSHQLYAEVQLVDGQTKTTHSLQYNFLSRTETNKQVRTVLLSIGGAIIGTLLLVALVQGFVITRGNKSRRQAGTPQNYGLLGGTICPKCGHPFPRHLWGINLAVGRLDRCNNCGKWVMTTRATPQALQQAEEAEIEVVEKDAQEVKIKEDDKDLLEETKYFDDI